LREKILKRGRKERWTRKRQRIRLSLESKAKPEELFLKPMKKIQGEVALISRTVPWDRRN
jgi:hypothetical protein